MLAFDCGDFAHRAQRPLIAGFDAEVDDAEATLAQAGEAIDAVAQNGAGVAVDAHALDVREIGSNRFEHRIEERGLGGQGVAVGQKDLRKRGGMRRNRSDLRLDLGQRPYAVGL